jgi:hypothetical protein
MEPRMTEKERLEAVREFARRVLQASWDGDGDVCGGDVQDWAQELGLIFSRKATERDEEDYTDICAGDNMFEFERWMIPATSKAA